MIIGLYRSTIYINKLHLCSTTSTPTLTLSIHIEGSKIYQPIKTDQLYLRKTSYALET
jgi:hypothetical protein